MVSLHTIRMIPSAMAQVSNVLEEIKDVAKQHGGNCSGN